MVGIKAEKEVEVEVCLGLIPAFNMLSSAFGLNLLDYSSWRG
jgi:hypothetical protein